MTHFELPGKEHEKENRTDYSLENVIFFEALQGKWSAQPESKRQ
jgi:hypothetical protein